MLILLFIYLLFSFFYSVSGFSAELPDNGEYVTRERTTMINGWFIWLVFLSHISGYKFEMPQTDYILLRLTIHQFWQCVVATFFFYSGYGIMTSLIKKGGSYAKSLIYHRFSLLLLHFAIAVMIFVGVQYCMGVSFPIEKILLSLIGWNSVGNSNWFIFITLVGYLFVAVSYFVLHKIGRFCIVGAVTIAFCILIYALKFKGGYWVDTCLCIPAGMLFCLLRKRIEIIIRSSCVPVWIFGILGTSLGVFFYRFSVRYFGLYGANIGAIFFAFGILLIFAGFRFKRMPKFLCWSGGPALFFLYVFQRIPMLLGVHWGIHTIQPYLYEFFCLVVTLLLALLSGRIFPWCDKQLANMGNMCKKLLLTWQK